MTTELSSILKIEPIKLSGKTNTILFGLLELMFSTGVIFNFRDTLVLL